MKCVLRWLRAALKRFMDYNRKFFSVPKETFEEWRDRQW